MWISCRTLEHGLSKPSIVANGRSNLTQIIHSAFMVVGFSERARFIYWSRKIHGTICNRPSTRNNPKSWAEIRPSLEWLHSTTRAINTSRLLRVREKVERVYTCSLLSCCLSHTDYGAGISCQVALGPRCVPETRARQGWDRFLAWLRAWGYWK